jgi:hypothetical protein
MSRQTLTADANRFGSGNPGYCRCLKNWYRPTQKPTPPKKNPQKNMTTLLGTTKSLGNLSKGLEKKGTKLAIVPLAKC